jgi:hypothetical protein
MHGALVDKYFKSVTAISSTFAFHKQLQLPYKQMKVLSIRDYKKASPGKFRIVQWIHSEPYQTGDEVDSIEEAQGLTGTTKKHEIESFTASIYNDQGEPVT